MKTLLTALIALAAAALGGCVVVPVEPAGVYGAPAVVVSPGHRHGGHRHGGHRHWR
jgi:hypothetical protein